MINTDTARRARALNDRPRGTGPVLYWMSRDQRVADNSALLHAQALALETHSPLAVVFTQAPGFLGAPWRAFDFMWKGLEGVEQRLSAKGMPFFVLTGPPADTLFEWTARHKAGAVVTDFDPLRPKRAWKESLARRLAVPLIEVDAHNIVPAWVASPKQEYGAYTLRPKLHRLLSDYLTPCPPLKRHPVPWPGPTRPVDWDAVRQSVTLDRRVAPVSWIEPGEPAAGRALARFIKHRLDGYAVRRNDPNADGQSDLSPYLHFGQLSARRAALEARRAAFETPDGQTFLEELIVRRELSDNYCLYNPHCDTPAGFPAWARKSLEAHRHDRRPFLYSRNQFESSATHDAMWNAAQTEMVKRGKMHGYMRMYWAKKILEWTPSIEEAMATAVYLNDRYELDGRDPNGYAGIAWSLGGVHDRPWFDRPVFGQIRYMSEGGCRSKFDTAAYIRRVDRI